MINDILNERKNTHGCFDDVASTSQRLEEIIYRRGQVYTNTQREALKCMCQKLARIACGDPSFADHWRDIAGYALLAVGEKPLKDYMDITKLREKNKMLWENIESMKQTNLALVKRLEGLK